MAERCKADRVYACQGCPRPQSKTETVLTDIGAGQPKDDRLSSHALSQNSVKGEEYSMDLDEAPDRDQPGRGVGQDKNGDDADDDEIENAWVWKRQRSDKANITLACPFYKKDRQLHGSCYGKRLSRIRDVKQHLRRRHYMPIYCPMCYKNFSDETKRDNHMREIACERGTHLGPIGISQEQQGELSKRAPRQHTEEEQWYGIFDILFPDHPRPNSAYIDSSVITDVLELGGKGEEHLTTETLSHSKGQGAMKRGLDSSPSAAASDTEMSSTAFVSPPSLPADTKRRKTQPGEGS
ncbi:hypothetical protein CH063_11070 [Colletotrichum higginsianum]|nr:hypothetical protein CH063_11070 [Colletotrichum higginsianum]